MHFKWNDVTPLSRVNGVARTGLDSQEAIRQSQLSNVSAPKGYLAVTRVEYAMTIRTQYERAIFRPLAQVTIKAAAIVECTCRPKASRRSQMIDKFAMLS
jgi:hypothetical protein